MKHIDGFFEIANGTKGTEYGHVPGHNYHDVIVSVGKRGSEYRAVALEVWGSAQERDEENGRNKVVTRDKDAQAALRECLRLAKEAGLPSEYLLQAHAECTEELAEWMHKQTAGRALFAAIYVSAPDSSDGEPQRGWMIITQDGSLFDFVQVGRDGLAALEKTYPALMHQRSVIAIDTTGSFYSTCVRAAQRLEHFSDTTTTIT